MSLGPKNVYTTYNTDIKPSIKTEHQQVDNHFPA